MAITVDWPTKVISVPKADLLLIQAAPTEIRQLDLDEFRLELKALEASEGMPFLDTHSHNPPVTIGGVTLARVVEIINGYTVTFEDGQYAVNLVGANSNVGDVINVNQVSVRSANSAGLTFSSEINSQSYINGMVYIDTDDGLPGTSFPRGTPKSPVNNIEDGLIIIMQEGLHDFNLNGTLSLTPLNDISNYGFTGRNVVTSILSFGGGSTQGSSFYRLRISGTANGTNFFANECIVDGALTGINGTIANCAIGADITLDAAHTGTFQMYRCLSNVAGTATPILDVNSASCHISCRTYTGGLEIRNFNQGNSASFDLAAGRLFLHTSCTSGTVVCRGVGRLMDMNGNDIPTGTFQGMTIVNETTSNITADQADQIKNNTRLIPGLL